MNQTKFYLTVGTIDYGFRLFRTKKQAELSAIKYITEHTEVEDCEFIKEDNQFVCMGCDETITIEKIYLEKEACEEVKKE